VSDEEDKKPKVIFDTTVVMQATISPKGAAGEAIRMMDEGKIDVYMTNQIRAEYEKTLRESAKYAQTTDKPQDQQRLRNVTPEFVSAQLQRFDEKANRLVNPPQAVEYERDREDEPVLNLNERIRADFIVSGDKDLQALNENRDWKEWYPDTWVIPPQVLEREVARWHEREAAKERSQPHQADHQPDHHRDHEPER